jgi:hypothetical protein
MLKVRILNEAQKPLSKIQDHNLKFISNNGKITADLADLDLVDEGDFEALVRNVPVLGKNKLVKYVTGRSFGKIFKLDNDHVFKLFSESLDPDEDYSWYRDSLKKLHRGTAKRTSLPVYDVGTWSGISKKIYWVEMAEVMPYDLWVESTGRDQYKLYDQFAVVRDFYEETHSSIVLDFAKWAGNMRNSGTYRKADAVEELYRMLLGKENDAVMTKREIAGILEALQDLARAGWSMADLYPRNIGVLKQSNPSKPIFIIFDK